ncbi:hypothetical protein H5368_01750 [Luteimonas sp. MC1782]|uniref:hypothetical protein n=1 Tax=Luteimonas sp. MC1782 TaxID=2760305 RepID=UPI0016012459|nr:hypothetical protein [Luteimonas sp. MC1782]MBB1471748.1 hypothetical protein [Luteimonas sp. MC1782]
MDTRILPLILLMALATACDRPAVPPSPPEVPDAPEHPPGPVASEVSTGRAAETRGSARPGGKDAAGAVDQALPEAFVVSTNEPFWNARVEAGRVVLNGPDVSDRRFIQDGGDSTLGERVVRARDDAGRTIDVRIATGRCEDSMSGAVFPYRGSVALDGGPAASGCARPADMPAPVPGEG